MSAAGLTLPAVIVTVALFVVPLAILTVYSFLTAGLFTVSGPLTLENYRSALEDHTATTLARNSLLIGVWSASAAVLIAVPVSYWLRYHARRWALPVLFLFTASMFASYLVRIYAWRSILGDHGLLNSALQGLGIVDHPLGFLLYNRFAVVLALVHIFLPYVVLVLYAAFQPLRPDYLEAAQDLGADAVRRWTRVVLPLLAPQLVSAWIFVFILAAGDYVTPQFLGGTNGSMLGVLVQQSFTVSGNWAAGAAVSLLMLLAFLGCYLVTAVLLRLSGLSRVKVG